MKLDEKKLDKIYQSVHSENCRMLMKILEDDKGRTYSDLKREFQILNKRSKNYNSFATFLLKLKRTGIVKKTSGGIWILTRIGIQTKRLMENFESICMTYDLSEADADGRVELVVVGRKL